MLCDRVVVSLSSALSSVTLTNRAAALLITHGGSTRCMCLLAYSGGGGVSLQDTPVKMGDATCMDTVSAACQEICALRAGTVSW